MTRRKRLVGLTENVARINIHAFGGNDGDPFLEVRVASGYGARWTMDWSNTGNQVHNVSFRGFLELRRQTAMKTDVDTKYSKCDRLVVN